MIPAARIIKGVAMEFSQDILTNDERVILRLRMLYKQYGYSQYRTSRFEEYALYADNKAFLPSGDIISFTGIGGKLMALRPDVTLSIIRNEAIGSGEQTKLYYNENVYRSDGNEFREHMQVGLECIGDIDVASTSEVLMLAKRSLEQLDRRSCLDISHMGFINGMLQDLELTPEQKKQLLQRIKEKNIHELNKLCTEYMLGDELRHSIVTLAGIYGSIGDCIPLLHDISKNNETDTALRELESIRDILQQSSADRDINLDFSIVNDISYYSGIIFQGYIEGIPTKVLSGGRYDMLLRKFGKRSGAIGFAVYLDLLNRYESAQTDEIINIALPKGRLGDKAYSIFESAGYGCPAVHEDSRKLVFESPEKGVRYFWVKPSDVSKYVERGAADIGIVGKDILLEHMPDVYELLDLNIGKCKMCVAAQKGYCACRGDQMLKVATNYPNIARSYYEKQGRDIDIIKLNGSVELAPLLGLSDVIVDIVETGRTLLENNMEPMQTIVDISARLVANEVSYKFNHKAISVLCAAVTSQVGT